MSHQTLEHYLKERLVQDSQSPEFRMRASLSPAGEVAFYLYPEDDDADTLDFVVIGNDLMPT